MKALIFPITFLVLAATAAACLDLTPYPLVETPEDVDASDEDAAGDGGDDHE